MRRLGWLVAGAPALAVALGCVSPVAYEIAQSSTVPIPTPSPPPSSRGAGDLWVGDSTVVHVGEPRSAPSSSAGLYLPQTQIDLSGTLRHSIVGGRVIAAAGVGDGPRLAPTTLQRPSGATGLLGGGVELAYVDEREPFSAHLTVDVLAGFVPSRQEVTPIFDDGTRGSTYTQSTLDAVVVVGAGIAAGYWLIPELRVMGGIGLRTHPTNRAAFVDVLAMPFDPPRSSISVGDVVGVAWAGLELRADLDGPNGVSFVPYVSWPFAGGPVIYAPIIGLGARITLGEAYGWERAGELAQERRERRERQRAEREERIARQRRPGWQPR